MRKKSLLKKIIGGLLIFGISPLSTFAAETTVGVNITGVPSYDVKVTLTADVEVDLSKGSGGSSSILVDNDSTVAVDMKVTNIEAITEGAPDNFIDVTDDEEYSKFYNAGKSFTEENIAFYFELGDNILSSSLSTSTLIPILPDTEQDVITLGYNDLSASGIVYGSYKIGDVDFDRYSYDDAKVLAYGGTTNDRAVLNLGVTVGNSWDEEQELEYSITSVFSMIDDNYNPVVSLPSNDYDFTRISTGFDYGSVENALAYKVNLWKSVDRSDSISLEIKIGNQFYIVSPAISSNSTLTGDEYNQEYVFDLSSYVEDLLTEGSTKINIKYSGSKIYSNNVYLESID